MIALNILLIAVVIVLIAGGLTWAIRSERRSKRATGGPVHPSEAPLHHNLMLPREMRGRRVGKLQGKRRDSSRS